MNPDEIIQLLSEAYDHLWHGRFRMALSAAQKVYDAIPNDYNATLCLAWALLENGNPAKAVEMANLAVELSGNTLNARLYRGFFLSRLSIYEGALSDLDYAIDTQQSLLIWAYLNKARSLAGLGRYFEALEELERAILIDGHNSEQLNSIKKWYKIASGLTEDLTNNKTDIKIDLLKEAEEALKQKENWFALFASRTILADPKLNFYHEDAQILELEAMTAMFQYRPALEKAESLKGFFLGNARFENIYNSLLKLNNKIPENSKIAETTATSQKEYQNSATIKSISKRVDFRSIPNHTAEFIDLKLFELSSDPLSQENRKYILQFDESLTYFIGAEGIFSNPYYKQQSVSLQGEIVWIINEQELGRNPFIINVEKDWNMVSFAQSWGSDKAGYWRKGQGRVELYINGEKVCERWFLIGSTEIVQNTNVKEIPAGQENSEEVLSPVIQTVKTSEIKSGRSNEKKEESESLKDLIQKLEEYTGLKEVKQSVKDFITYLEFIDQRKKLGLKTQGSISINCIFQGNPGTGKTTIARLMGKILKAMGILEKGHVMEVDRASLVGQYVGETALKTEKVIKESLGGVLFIDEAYTLVKKSGSSQDFGQEAIDTLLKRMEDYSNELVVIAAGYPEEMQLFLESNPGIKSRFNHIFNFEDFTPDELLEIFNGVAKEEDFTIEENALKLLRKGFTELYRSRDKTFGNARLVNQFFNEAKMKLGRRVISLKEEERTEEALRTILAEDIEAIFERESEKGFSVPIDEEKLSNALEKLNSLTGIKSIKNEINEIVKLVRYYKEQGEEVADKFSSHLIFSGNPGTGKTTVARLFGEIYSALGILSKGHLIDTDRQGLVAGYVGQTAKQTSEVIDKALGGTLFIDEAYSLTKKGDSQDFGQEAIDTLLKRMEDDRGKFIVIAAGYTEEMDSFLESNPGLRSRFTKTFNFEDYSPEELIEITKKQLASEDKYLSEEALEGLKKYYNELYRNRDKTFGNARLVRNIVDNAKRNQMLRLADLPLEERTEEVSKEIKLIDLESLISLQKEKKAVKVEGDIELLNNYIKDLHSLIGLESVKRSVDKLINSLKVAKLREERGLSVIEKSLHSVFMGNPGTGKTTVARLMSKIYKEMGLLERGHLVEVDRTSLVAGYQGQTAIKTESIIDQALGGTLFIDEAYTLSRGANDFGQEAIDTLLKRMEDYRGRFVVIVAGYPAEMDHFLDSNPGLQSRFANNFVFDDYNSRQMLEIAVTIASENGYRLDEGALQYMLDIFTKLYENRDKNFGNARTARQILYESISNQEERIAGNYNCSDNDLTTITIEDVERIII
ncbi:MAG: AAA family ATPase [Bacteroidota bacterium]|nr:AAA family ATPase [Bacteroidota bacterium]